MSVGEQLTAARVRAGKSIEDVSAATRIRPGLLAAMEEDDFSRCGGNFYARGHLRSIARVLHVDPEPLLAEFDAAHATPSRGRQQDLADPVGRPTVHPARPRWAVVMGAILVGLLGWGMVRLFTLPSDVEATASPSTPTPVVSSAPVSVASTPVVSASTVRPPPPPPVKVVPKTVRVTLEAVGRGTYVRLRNVHGVRLFSGTLRGGSAHSLTYGGGIEVLLGVPKNVRVFVNGTRVQPPSPRFTVALNGTIKKTR